MSARTILVALGALAGVLAAQTASAAAPAPAPAQTPAQTPVPAAGAARPPAAPPYTVKGFRSAQFGMDEAAVRSAAAKDFGVAPESLARQMSLVDGTTALVLELPKLEPGPSGATVQYVMGASSGRLMHVNVVWKLPDTAPPAERDELIAAGVKLTNYYASHSWAPKRALANVPTGPNSIIAFAGQDTAGGAVELRLDGVAFNRTAGGAPVKSPLPTGPASLRLVFDQNPTHPDIKAIREGAF